VINKIFGALITLFFIIALFLPIYAADDGIIVDPSYYDPYTNNPPGPPPNYNLIDSVYFQGVPDLPDPLENNNGGYYIFNDTAAGKWYIANFLYSRGNALEQFHGCILATLEQPPAPNVNIWAQGFELSCDLKQNDRWGWVKWPDEIAPNLYEIWWDITIDYARIHDTGDYRDTLGVCVAGCAIDFNIWASGHGDPLREQYVYLGKNMIPLSQIPGFTDTYLGVTDQYQLNNAETDPNLSRFTAKNLPGATYNAHGLVLPGTTYGNRYAGSWAYEANGIQFATLFCPPTLPPNFVEPPDMVDPYVLCNGGTIYDTLIATDPNPDDILTITQLSGTGILSGTSSVTPATSYFEFSPVASGTYEAIFEVTDGTGNADTLEITYEVEISSAPVVQLPDDSTLFICGTTQLCLPVDIIDNDCDVISVTTNFGQYTGTLAGFDQIKRLNQMGGTVTQIGGGDPGKILYTASDFVLPINSLSGVSITLPHFDFGGYVVDYGSFPTSVEPGNSADFLLGPPTDLTFTTPGPGGPDGGDGDGSIAFYTGNYCEIGFNQMITSCNGANVDFIIFTNTNGGGTAQLIFKKDGIQVHSVTRVIPGGTASSGYGGVTFDLPDGIEFNQVKITSLSGTLEIDAFSSRTEQSSTTDDVCFTVDTSGIYEIIVSVTDACGNIGSDATLITVNKNKPPVVNAGSDLNLFLCELGEICFGVNFSDPDNNLASSQLYSGPGVLSGSQVCFTPANPSAYTFVLRAVDECGLVDYDTVVVNLSLNGPPIAENRTTVTADLCEPEQFCHTFTATDPNGGNLTWSLLYGVGSITPAGEFCFTPMISGTYNAVVLVADTCGAMDTTTISYNIIINSAPVAVEPSSPTQIFLCDIEDICYQFSASDIDGDILYWTKLYGDGTVTQSGEWCFNPGSAGNYSTSVEVVDSCGKADTVSLTYDVQLNEQPTISLGNDTTYILCTPQEICVPYTVSDPQGSGLLIESMISGYGVIDTSANQICFTPTTNGCFEFIIEAVDSCGESSRDTLSLCVNFGEQVNINCPSNEINLSLCSPDSVCQLLTVTPSIADVSTSQGTFQNNQLCFYADTSGRYEITVIAATLCDTDTCQIVFNVEIGQSAQINCPSAQNIFICQPDNICVPVGINGSGVSVTVSPIGNYSAGNVCFPADTSGHYEITIVATTLCGSDSCVVIADVVINTPPIIVNTPVVPVDTFICNTSQICYQFEVEDPDGGTLNWNRLSGAGTVSNNGLFCFNATTSGTYTVTVAVTDNCGQADTTSLSYNVQLNTSPVFAFGNDTTIFLCESQLVCSPYILSDAENNITEIEVLTGNAVVDTNDSRICYMPVTEGNMQFIVRVADACGKQDIDTLNVFVNMNNPPVVDAGDDQDIFLCNIVPVCWPVQVSDPDNNIASVELINSPGTFDGFNICFTPNKSWCYEFILKATDNCGLEAVDTVAVCVTINSAPVVNAGEDQTLFLCAPEEICWPVSFTDPDNNIQTSAIIEGAATYDGSSLCFTPGASGIYTFVMQATDACGLIDRDTVVIDVTINTTPACIVPNDTLIFLCDAQQVCLPAYGDDPDGNLSFCQVNVGTIVNGNWCYTPASDQVVTVTMHCEDACGAICESPFTVEFVINNSPQISFGNDMTVSLCSIEEICLPYFASDDDYPRPVVITLLEGPGTINEADAEICFTPSSSGIYTFVIKIEDECGEFDIDTINVNTVVNTPPLVDAGEDQTLFLCDANSTICWDVSCTDNDNNLTDCIFNGPGTYDGNSICFEATASGSYLFTLQGIDACDESVTDSVWLHITINSRPTLITADDFSVALCTPEEICFNYTPGDNDGLNGLIESMPSGTGVIDTLANTICFTPVSAGNYEFILKVKDQCNAAVFDTVNVTVAFGQTASINNCPTGEVNVSLCEPDNVCYMLDITPLTANVTASLGTYDAGQLCFYADTTGIYQVQVIASDECGADTCDISFNVTVGSAAQITCPGLQERFICSPQNVCVPVSVIGQAVSVTVSPIGSYNSGNVCFTPDTSGLYELKVVATTSCGSDSCIIYADITINTPPQIVEPANPVVDTFICTTDNICYQFSANDIDGGTLTWSKLSGIGNISSSGLWCFNADENGTYTVTAKVVDGCGTEDVVTLTYNVTTNTAPVISLGVDLTRFLCQNMTECFPYTLTDAQDNVTLIELLSGYGSLDSPNNQICFTTDTAGIYSFIVKATDDCGAFDIDTMKVTVQINKPPVVDAGVNQSKFMCDLGQICWDASCYDPDGNIDSCYVLGNTAVYSASQICFTPDTVGHYVFVLRAVDDCGQADQDTVIIDVSENTPPLCQIPNDTSIFQCTAAEISLPLTAVDPDGNFDHCEIITGPGSIVSGNWVYTPTANQNVKVKVMCLDECGASCIDSFNVAIVINAAPVVSMGNNFTAFLCQPGQVCWPVLVTDINNNIETVELITGNAVYDQANSRICFDAPSGERSYQFILKATDLCGAEDYDTIQVTIDFNTAPTLNLPPNFVAYLDAPGDFCFNVSVSDEDDNLDEVFSSAPGVYNDQTGQICFTVDSSGQYCFVVTATDDCGLQTFKTICIDVEIDECIHVQIEKTHNTYQGQFKTVNIYLNGSGKELGGFDFLISYDQSALLVNNVYEGTLLQSCGWEYFTYRFGPDGNCYACPSGLLRIVAIADINNGAYHPGCYLNNLQGSLAEIKFLVSNDRALGCMYVPIKFFWMDCGDNSISSRIGDTLWVSRGVFEYEGTPIANTTYGFPGYFGADDDCLIGGGEDKPSAIRCVDYTNGGVDIVCADSIDGPGDINLNEIPFEIADAVLLSRYFVYGLSVFTINVQGQIAASDVNGDGLALSVADLVYLVRIITGDAIMNAKINPNKLYEAELAVQGNTLEIIKTDMPVGALALTVEGNVIPVLEENAEAMDMNYNFDGKNTRILVYSSEGNAFLKTGGVLSLNQPVNIIEIDLGSYDGFVMTAKMNTLPEHYELKQNYPNPFNPVTLIEFALPEAGKWDLVVFNILGQVVKTWSEESQAGYIKIEWDASEYASGVYFYRLRAGEFSDTRKMVLLK